MADAPLGGLDRRFRLTENGTTLGREARAGLTTFLTMSYILFVNPDILSKAIPVPNAFAQLLFATALASAVGSITMGLVARYPFATAPGMGLNAYFAFSVVLQQKIPWPVALGAVFVEGLIFMLLSWGGIRQAIVNGIPTNIKYATSAGIGMFLCLIGLKSGGIVVAHPVTLLTRGSLGEPAALITMFGLLLISVLMVRGVAGSILIGIAASTLVAVFSGAHVYGPEGHLTAFPGLPGGSPVAAPVWPRDIFLAMDLRGAVGLGLLGIVFTFLFVEIFDTAGTLIGLADMAGFLDDQGNLPRANQAFFADAVATTAGAVLGTSTTTAYIESAAGIREGGRTGLTAVVVGLLFAASVFLWPLASAVPGCATAPALIVVGAMMSLHLGRMEWHDFSEVIPAFLTIVVMPFTYSIANGVSFGIISYVIVKLTTGRGREVNAVMVALAVILVARFIWLGE